VGTNLGTDTKHDQCFSSAEFPRIDFYLRGVSVSGERVQFINKLVLGRAGELTVNDLENGLGGKVGLGVRSPEANFYAAVQPHDPLSCNLHSEGEHLYVFADPMREGLRCVFVGWDALREEDAQWDDLLQGVSRVQSGMMEDERRKRCSLAVKGANWHFKHSYAFVSSTYSALRSEFLSST